MAKIRRIMGAMPFGGQLNEAQSHAMIKDWLKQGFDEIDTAIMYQDGKSEKIIGKMHVCRDNSKVKIATKANPSKGFKAGDVVNQLNDSLSSLQTNSLDIFYLHLPDHNVPIEETLKGVDQLHKEGKFKEFGLSNYASWEVTDIYHICKSKGYVLPTVYQGMYNALTRDIELELLPALRRFGIRFYVYNPLAGGLLSGKYDFTQDNSEQPKGRFFSSGSGGWTNKWTDVYQKRFWTGVYKQGAVNTQKIIKDVYGDKVSLLQASMRWLVHHSCLRDDDGLILGMSKPEHLQSNIDALNGGPLHEDVVNSFEQGWNLIKSKCPKYNR